MSNYLFTYSGGSGMPETEEEQAAEMAAWTAWFGELGSAVVDGGAPVGFARTVASDGSVTDGAGATPILGYSLIAADSIDDAVGKTNGCPVRNTGGTITVSELVAM